VFEPVRHAHSQVVRRAWEAPSLNVWRVWGCGAEPTLRALSPARCAGSEGSETAASAPRQPLRASQMVFFCHNDPCAKYDFLLPLGSQSVVYWGCSG
jgi:hypothetical protein